MKIVRDARGLTSETRELRAAGESVAFVPTMGALHRGHVELFNRASNECSRTMVSIFVNRLQFDDADDFARYPVTIDEDLDVCRDRGVDVVYLPSNESMYPRDFTTTVSVGRIGEPFEGSSRPGHFDGVATVVAKLLIASEADVAVFGQKDYQQVAVIRRLVVDLDLPVRIVTHPTVRDNDGLALSSRNVRLSESGRRRAGAIPAALDEAFSSVAAGEDDPAAVESRVRSRLEDAGLVVDYATVVDRRNLNPVESAPGAVLLVAVLVDGVRLIDNVEL